MSLFFFFNDTATTEIYTLSLHDALPICLEIIPTTRLELGIFPPAYLVHQSNTSDGFGDLSWQVKFRAFSATEDRKSTRLNSSHQIISYAVFCLKKKKI